MTAVREETREQHDPIKPYMWKPGVSANPKGRPKGARSKIGETFLAAMLEDFEKHGVEAIQTVRETRPHEYLKVVASILPKELNVNTNALGDMDDDELAATLAAIRHLASQVDSAIAGAGAEEAGSTKSPVPLLAIQ